MPTSTPNMNLTVPIIGTDSGLTWEQSVNSNSATLDAHNHSAGMGVPIPSAGIGVDASLPFNNYSATGLQATVFTAQASLATPLATYVIGSDLYYNNGAGVAIQMTSGSSVNATTSGISSGTASASFVSSVLVVNANTNLPANIQVGSLLLGNNSVSSHFLTLSPPAAMASDFTLTLPSLPASQKIMTLDASGNISAPYTVDGSTITVAANIIGVPAGGIGTTQIANGAVTTAKLVTGLALGTAHDFSTSTTYTIPTGVSVIWVEMIGGGGGGGGGGRVGSQGGQGGSGSHPVRGTFAVTAGQVLTISIGAGGAGGAAQGTVGANGNNGSTGGITRLQLSGVTLLYANGQPGGYGSNNGGPNVSGWRSISDELAGGSGGNDAPRSAYALGGTCSPASADGGGGGGPGAFSTSFLASNGGSSGLGSGASTGGAGYGAGGGGGQLGSATSSNSGGAGGDGYKGFCRIITVGT